MCRYALAGAMCKCEKCFLHFHIYTSSRLKDGHIYTLNKKAPVWKHGDLG